MSGSVGVIYRQFSVSLAISILFSGFTALTMTPALCATLLKPIPKGHHVERKGLYGWFNRHFGRLTSGYSAMNTRLIASAGRMMLAFVVIVVVLGFTYTRLPSAFLPTEDQGYVMTDIQLPPGATYQRTLATTQQMENYYLERSAVADIMSLQGFSFSGGGQNAGGVRDVQGLGRAFARRVGHGRGGAVQRRVPELRGWHTVFRGAATD